MVKNLLIALFFISSKLHGSALETELRSGAEVPLSKNEKKAIKQIQNIENGKSGRRVLPDGSVEYLYGYGIPSIPCRFLDSCTIIFENGEYFLNNAESISLADSRVEVVPMLEKIGDNFQSLLVITPKIYGVSSNLTIKTNKRIYSFKIKSTKNLSFNTVKFRFAKSFNDSFKKYKKILNKTRQPNIYKTSGRKLKIVGTAPWKPINARLSSGKTVIEFPNNFSMQRPVLYSFLENKKEIVEYRVKNNNYIIDHELSELVLVVGDVEVLITGQVIAKKPKELFNYLRIGGR